MARALGRRKPPDFTHVAKYPLRAVVEAEPELNVELRLPLPRWHWSHDQGREGSCVGHGAAMERAIVNAAQVGHARRYDPLHIWNEAKRVDEWEDTNPGDDNGTSVRAAYDVLRDLGACRVRSMRLEDGVPVPVGAQVCSRAEGVLTNRWARSVDDMRLAISRRMPVVIGVDWYSGFDDPVERSGDWWLPTGRLGRNRGGHCVCVYGASDKREAFRVKNSWGRDYPLVWLPYATMERLLDDGGEAALVTDR